MRRRPVLAVAVTAAAAAVGSAVLVGSGAVGAADAQCTAWGTLPAHVGLAGRPVTVHMTLRGTSGCVGDSFDNGATASLRGPGVDDPQRWSRFGAAETETFDLTVNRPGRYVLTDGDVQLYDGNYDRVPATWRPTSVEVKRAARFRGVVQHGGTVSARLQTYGQDGWTARGGAAVTLQRRTRSGWTAVARQRTSDDGKARFAAGSGRFRVVSGASADAWGAASRQV